MNTETIHHCNECSCPFLISKDGIANHIHPDSASMPMAQRIDYDADADHVPYEDEFGGFDPVDILSRGER